MRLNRRSFLQCSAATALTAAPAATRAAGPSELRLDFATYNPLSLILKEKGLVEKALAPDGISVRWVQTLGSNKALEFLNAGSIDIGSTAGAAALIGRINGNPIKTVGVFSRPEWTALVCRADTPFTSPADLKGKSVAVTRGTDPHIFLVRALDAAGLTEKDVRLVLLQHPDGKTALVRGDVDAWAGLDPMMAQAEIENGAKLFYRKPEANTWGVLNAREAFAAQNPDLVKRVLATYEEARQWALANPAELQAIMAKETKLPAQIVARQLERTDHSNKGITDATRQTVLEAGLALQKAGVIKPDVDVKAATDALIDTRFAAS
jgi:sulfonate transport system substrate-binding protein